MKNRSISKGIRNLLLITIAMTASSQMSQAADHEEYSRGNGVMLRIGAGAPDNFNLGVGYRFNPHFSLAAEAYSYSGLTTFTGVLDARYHVLDKAFTPFVSVKAGYGLLGKTYEYKDYRDVLGACTAGVSWKGFDLGAGLTYDSFHKAEFTLNLSWTYCFTSSSSCRQARRR